MIPLSRILSVVVVFAFVLFSVAQAQSLAIGTPYSISKRFSPGDQFMGITLRGALRLRSKDFNGLHSRELSGLAWDSDEERLYALSDDGHIVHLRPIIVDQTLIGVEIIDAVQLRDVDDQALQKEFTDAEGLVARNSRNRVLNDTILAISFEEPPRVDLYRPDGTFVKHYKLPLPLRNKNNYNGKNHELEALTDHPDYGLITAPEKPLVGDADGKFRLYNLRGDTWKYQPLDSKYSALVGMESMQNGDLLLLERRFSSIFKPVIFALRRLTLPIDDSGQARIVEEIVHFDTSGDWSVDNFEGVARHEKNHYFLISDDNENPIQKTLLVYFEINSDGNSRLGSELQRAAE